MNRREFAKYVGILAPLLRTTATWAKETGSEIAFTFDDPKTEGGARLSWQEINEGMLTALAKYRIKAALFVTGKRTDSEAGRSLVAAWNRAGHTIANHSYSHLFFNNSEITMAEFESDVLRNEPLIRDYTHFAPLFRFPYFKEGETAEKRDGMRDFLRAHGYRIGRATIDASDWAISRRLEARIASLPKADTAPYGVFFRQHIWERAQFYDSLARRVLGHTVRHTVLLHHNALNALFLEQLIGMFVDNGWRPVDAQYAYGDPLYDLQPKTLPAGESLIWALAKESGQFEPELRYPGEDDVYENPKMDALRL
ncbi:MAG TPA: polysaccharide deacetylase family protein [Terriglobales bacterium]|nr:polysaccharide deacetylase family protein [Terriglobales bacterium]